MKSKVLATLSVALLAGIALAQTSAQSPATGAAQQPGSTELETNSSPSQNTASTGEASASNQVAPGLLIPAELSKAVDAKKAKTGDPVVAKITQDMLANGRVVIPHNSKIIGHVTQAKGREKGEAESSLGIAFDKIVMKDGRELPLNASIQAIAAAQNNAAVNNEPITGQPAGVPGGGGPGRSGGAMGGEGRTVGNVGGTAPNSGTIGSTSGSSAGGAPQAAPNVRLNSNSQGVIGFPGFSLNAAADASQGSVISSQNKNVKLDGGTELMLRTR
jgi:hypothetical protein